MRSLKPEEPYGDNRKGENCRDQEKEDSPAGKNCPIAEPGRHDCEQTCQGPAEIAKDDKVGFVRSEIDHCLSYITRAMGLERDDANAPSMICSST